MNLLPARPRISTSVLSMLNFPPEGIVHKGNVFFLLYVAGGLLATVAAGSRFVDVAVRAAHSPAQLLCLSNMLMGLVGLRCHTRAANSLTKRKLKRLHFTESLSSLLDVTGAAQLGSHDFMRLMQVPGSLERQTNLEPSPANCISAKRCRISYILICGVNSQPILMLSSGDNGSSKLKSYTPSDQLQWLLNFSRKSQERGDVIVLLVCGHNGQINTEPKARDAAHERGPTRLTLGMSALSVVLLWMFLRHIAVCAVVFFTWTVQQHIGCRVPLGSQMTTRPYLISS